MPLNVGQLAPNFTLFDADRKEHSLDSFLVKTTVLATIPGAFTSVCTEEVCEFRNTYKEFEALNSQIVVVSVDSPFVLKAYAEAHKLNFPLLSDYSREVSNKYSGLHENFAGMTGYSAPKRGVFVIDQKGICQYSWISENPGSLPSFESIRAALPR